MPQQLDQRKVLLAGASGLTGGFLLQALLADSTVAVVHALSRRPLDVRHPKLQVLCVDFGQLPPLPEVDEVYLALGTTIKVAGSQSAFRALDLHANLAVADAARAAGARRIGLVSAAGANARAAVFYNQVKGELEDALRAMELETLVIARPSLLLNSRAHLQQAPRLGEQLAIPIARLLAPLFPDVYRPVHAQAVPLSLLKTLPSATGVLILSSAELARIGKRV